MDEGGVLLMVSAPSRGLDRCLLAHRLHNVAAKVSRPPVRPADAELRISSSRNGSR